ncbi:hypothetical protein HMPREF1012_01080 [Bacillus sp. BT1B_CT2]|nr:hypothetical protein HMPREF1012_01080 [Bacillus sp. BT1B_CT2]
MVEFSEIVKHQLTTTGLRKLTKFIRKEFPAKGQPHSQQMKKYEALKKLSDNDLSSGIARMVRIESSFDHSKFAAIFVLIIGSLLGAVKFMLIDNPQPLGGEVYFTFTMFAASLLLIAVVLDKRDMTTASYFKELLEQAKADKGNEKELPSSMTQSSNRIEAKIQTGWLFGKKDNFKQAKDLDKVFLNWSDVEIISYITSYFGYWTEKNKKAELQRIRGLNLDTIILGIARMKEIEESNDNSKIIPGFSAGLVLIATQASISYRYMKSPLWGSIGGVLLAFIFYIFVLKGIQHGRNLRSRAVKYRSLLEQVKSEMEKAS